MKKYFVGIDIGGTRIKAVLRCENDILIKKSILTKPELSSDEIICRVINLVKSLSDFVEDINSQLFGIGVGVPGIFDKFGTVINLPNLSVLNGINFNSIFKSEFGKSVKVKIVNDAQLPFYYYKNLIGFEKGIKNILFLTLGTSFGCSICLDGKLFVNKFGSSEFAHSRIFGNKKTTDFISTRFLLSGFSGNIKENKNILPFDIYGKKLGQSISVLHNVLGFDKIILTGGITNYSNLFLDDCLSSFEKNSYLDICDIEVLKSSFIGAIGASYLVLK